jgi:hypothetical protein
MTTTIEVRNAFKIVRIILSGLATESDLLNLYVQLRAGFAGRGYSACVDLAGAQIAMPTAGACALGRSEAIFRRVALYVGTSEVSYGLARAFQIMSGLAGNKAIAIFKDADRAQQWICRSQPVGRVEAECVRLTKDIAGGRLTAEEAKEATCRVARTLEQMLAREEGQAEPDGIRRNDPAPDGK